MRTDARHAWKRPVLWRTQTTRVAPGDARVPPASAAEVAAMSRTLDTLVAVFKATPTGSRGEGFWVNDARRLGFVHTTMLPPGAPLKGWPLEFETGLFPFYHEDVQQGGSWRQSVRGETESIAFEFNRLPGPLQQPVIAREPPVSPDREPVELFLRPRVTDTFFGLPVYDRDRLVIARAGRDPWAPVALGRALRALMPAYRKDRDTAEQRLARLRQEHEKLQAPEWEQAQRDTFERQNGPLRESRPSNYATRLANLERYLMVTRAEAQAAAHPQRDRAGAWYWNPVEAHSAAQRQLDTLTPSEAAAPACWVPAPDQAPADAAKPSDGRYAVRGDVVPASTAPGCHGVVERNPAYFDVSLPRTAPQILTFWFGRCLTTVREGRLDIPAVSRFDAPPQGCHRHRTMWNEADWTAIAGLLAP